MAVLDKAADALRDIEEELLEPARGGMDSVRLAERIRAVRQLLAGEETRWVGTTEAKRLLGLGSENTVKAWARGGLLGSRTLPNGRVQVRLDDVLRRREEGEGLSAMDGEELSSEDLRALGRGRPGRNPWDREEATQTR